MEYQVSSATSDMLFHLDESGIDVPNVEIRQHMFSITLLVRMSTEDDRKGQL